MDPLEEMPVVVNCVLTRECNPGKNDVIPVQTMNLFYAKRPSDKDNPHKDLFQMMLIRNRR